MAVCWRIWFGILLMSLEALSSKSTVRSVKDVVDDVSSKLTTRSVRPFFCRQHFTCRSSEDFTNGFREKHQGSKEWLTRKLIGISFIEFLCRIWSNTRYLLLWLYRETVQLRTGQLITWLDLFSNVEETLPSFFTTLWLRALASHNVYPHIWDLSLTHAHTISFHLLVFLDSTTHQ